MGAEEISYWEAHSARELDKKLSYGVGGEWEHAGPEQTKGGKCFRNILSTVPVSAPGLRRMTDTWILVFSYPRGSGSEEEGQHTIRGIVFCFTLKILELWACFCKPWRNIQWRRKVLWFLPHEGGTVEIRKNHWRKIFWKLWWMVKRSWHWEGREEIGWKKSKETFQVQRKGSGGVNMERALSPETERV